MNHSGLNIKDAMARLMGNKNLYLKLLDCFQKDYAQFDTQLVQLLEAGNYELPLVFDAERYPEVTFQPETEVLSVTLTSIENDG